jgi:tetratricopeptide (TPR) repeat protein
MFDVRTGSGGLAGPRTPYGGGLRTFVGVSGPRPSGTHLAERLASLGPSATIGSMAPVDPIQSGAAQETRVESPGARCGPAALLVRKGRFSGDRFLLDSDLIALGRDRSCGIVLAEDLVSSRHAAVGRSATGEYWIRDEGSKNGTWLNGKQIEGATSLREGDRITLAQTGPELLFTQDPARAVDGSTTRTFRGSATRSGMGSASIVAAMRDIAHWMRGTLDGSSGVRRAIEERIEERVARQVRTRLRIGIAIAAGAIFVSAALLIVWLVGLRSDASNAASNALVPGSTSGSSSLATAETSATWRADVDLRIEPIFGSLFHSYRERPIGNVRVVFRPGGTTSSDSESASAKSENAAARGKSADAGKTPTLENATLEFVLFVQRKGQTAEEKLLNEEFILPIPALQAGESWEHDITPKLASGILSSLDLEVTARATVAVAGIEIGRITRAVMVYGQNVVDWRDPAQIGAFIDPSDIIVRRFVDAAWKARRAALVEGDFLPENLLKAVTLVSALAAFELDYLSDGRNPTTFAGDGVLRDQVNFPGETLRSGTGDCDDLSVLCCSILEEAGVSTAFIVAPTHVLLMFDSGLAESALADSPLDPEEVIVREGRVWIPLEATVLGRRSASFNAAWHEAVRFKKEVESGGVAVVDVATAWRKYRPLRSEPNELTLRFLESAVWVRPGFEEHLHVAIEELRRIFRDRLHGLLERIRSEYGDGLAAAQSIGLAYQRAGFLREARETFARAVFGADPPLEPAAISAWSGSLDEELAILLEDLAIATAVGDPSVEEYRRAAAYLERAVERLADSMKGESMVRLALLHLLAGNSGKGAAWVARAAEIDPGLRRVYDELRRGDGLVAGASSAVNAYLEKAFVFRGQRLR